LAGFYRLNPLQTQRSETSDEDIRADSNKSAQSAYVRVCGLERERGCREKTLETPLADVGSDSDLEKSPVSDAGTYATAGCGAQFGLC